MRIRRAEISDLEGITRLWLEMMNFHINKDDNYRIKRDAMDIYRNYAKETILDPEKRVFVYEDKKEILGYIFVEIGCLPPVYEVNKIASVTELSVTQERRRNGIGRLLLHFAERWAKDQGVSRIECIVSANNEASQSFWKKNGFLGYNIVCFKEVPSDYRVEDDRKPDPTLERTQKKG